MSKKILVIFYSQSGQLKEILKNFSAPLIAAGNNVETIEVAPVQPYPFPWTSKSFFSVMPDSVFGRATSLHPFLLKEKKYDLVVFGYQAWFLSPSIPSNSILNHPEIKNILKDTKVITVTGARNMWLSAMEKVRVLLKQSEARLVGNIAMVDRHANIISLFTILYWMFSGKKDRLLNIFPPPGVSQTDIKNAEIYGAIVQKHLQWESWQNLQDELTANNAVVIKYNLMFIESKARKIFPLWATFIEKRKNKSFWLVVFKYYLIIALLIAAPIILTVDAIFFRPFLKKKIRRQKLYYAGVNQNFK